MNYSQKFALSVAGFLAAVLILWGSSRFYEVYAAELAFDVADRAGQGDDACRAAHNVAAIHLSRGNQKSYEDWANRATIVCYNANTRRGLFP